MDQGELRGLGAREGLVPSEGLGLSGGLGQEREERFCG
jgi:hypothetical protein